MKTSRLLGSVSLLLITVFGLSLAPQFTSVAEARVGGGRTSGFRGSRGFAPRPNYRTAPTNPAPYGNPYGNTMGQPAGGGFMRGMMGGLAGGLLGSMLFRSMGFAGTGAEGGGGFGLLEMLLLGGLAFYLFRRFAAPKPAEPNPMMSQGQPYQTYQREIQPEEMEEDASQTLRRYNASFNPESFKEERMDDFMRLQAAWNQRDVASIERWVSPELKTVLAADIEDLKRSNLINKIENIAVRKTELVEGWQERGIEYATVRFRANLTDYTVNDQTGAVVSGSQTEPVKFEEEWTFARDLDASPGSWKVSAMTTV